MFKKWVSRLTEKKKPGAGNFTEELSHKILVGSHHKTGTVWMRNVFSCVCRELGLRFFSGEQKKLPKDFDVFMQNHSRFMPDKFSDTIRGIHIIRDPRDRIVSGMYYHQKSKESWLHKPMQNLGGSTYQEKINSFDKIEDQLMFEMEHSGRWGIEEMLSWDYRDDRFMNVKYEELIIDHDLRMFHDIFTFLGFPGSAIPVCLDCAYKNSLFSGNIDKSVHVRSGKSSQWKTHFTTAHKKRFAELFGDALIKLGYEKDNRWIE
jgi:hypothetical protein